MSNEIATINSELIQKLVLSGDISSMNPDQKVNYYRQFCESLGLNPLTQPFQIIKFQGKEKLYATKDCTEQLRKIHGVSIIDIASQELRGVYVVTVKAVDKTGKTDAATGVVSIGNLQGDNLANALMKAETKAKRRVTLSICGLSVIDETEISTIKDAIIEDIPHTNVEHGLKSGKDILTESHPNWDKVISALKNGYTIDQIYEKYEFTSAIEKKLKNSIHPEVESDLSNTKDIF